MKNKADRYKIQAPHDYKDPRKKISYTAIIGIYEKERIVTFYAIDDRQAIQVANDYCATDESVLNIIRNGKTIYQHPFR